MTNLIETPSLASRPPFIGALVASLALLVLLVLGACGGTTTVIVRGNLIHNIGSVYW